MALSDKNIVITPNKGNTSDPQIVFSAADANTNAQQITVKAYPASNGTLSFEASNGQLFSITNSFVGTIFSVNDISGIPSIEVQDTGDVKIAQYGGTIYLGGTSAIKIPVGTTAQQPAAETGLFRFNTSNTSFEGYNGTSWQTFGTSITSSLTANTVSANSYSIYGSEFIGTNRAITYYGTTHNSLGLVSGNTTIDLRLGNYVSANVTGITTWTFSNAISSPVATGFVLELTNGGSATQNWPSVKWPGGTAPTLTAAGVDVLTFVTDDGGTTWRGVVSMLDSK